MFQADRPSAPEILAAFINEVEALINGDVLTPEQGQVLIDLGRSMLATLEDWLPTGRTRRLLWGPPAPFQNPAPGARKPVGQRGIRTVRPASVNRALTCLAPVNRGLTDSEALPQIHAKRIGYYTATF